MSRINIAKLKALRSFCNPTALPVHNGGKDDEKDVHIYFRVFHFHSENDDRYEAVPVVLKDDKLIEAKSVEDAILRRDD